MLFSILRQMRTSVVEGIVQRCLEDIIKIETTIFPSSASARSKFGRKWGKWGALTSRWIILALALALTLTLGFSVIVVGTHDRQIKSK